MLRIFFQRRIVNPVLAQNMRYSKGFLQSLISKVKEESSRDAELKENIRKFREETAKLEQSKELQSVRDFYKKIEKELPADTFEKIRDRLNVVTDKLKESGHQIAMNESLKKSLENLSKAGSEVKGFTKSMSDTEFLKTVMKSIEAVEEELQLDRAKVYVPPTVLKTRKDLIGKVEERIIQPDENASELVLHKDSAWYATWQNFKDNNPVVQKFFDVRTSLQESDHIMARSVRFVSDRLSQLLGGMGSDNELQLAYDELVKLDPHFDTESFLRFCRFFFIPTILEALVRRDMPILKDWCYEATFNVISTRENEDKLDTLQILDISHLEIQAGGITERGPFICLTFQSQEIHGKRQDGEKATTDNHRIVRMARAWALCRDTEELHPWAAWRLLDASQLQTEQFL